MKIGALRAFISGQVLAKSFSSFRGGQASLNPPRVLSVDSDCAYNRALKAGKFELRLLIPGFFFQEFLKSCDRAQLKQCFENLMPFLQNADGGTNQELTEIRLLIHRSLVSQIKTKLGNSADCQIITFTQLCPLSTDQVVLIKTDKNNLAELVQGLADLLCEFPIDGHVAYYNGSSYKPIWLTVMVDFTMNFFPIGGLAMKNESSRRAKPVDIVVKMVIC